MERTARFSSGRSPSAPVTEDAFERISAALLDDLRAAGAIDAVFLDRELTVRAVRTLSPGFAATGCRGAAHTLELPAGRAAALGLIPGRKVAIDRD